MKVAYLGWPLEAEALAVCGVGWGVNTLKLNGQPVAGRAILETLHPGGQRIWASITVAPDSSVYQTAREAVLANDLEVTLAGEAHEPLKDVMFDFRAKGQLVNGRVGQGVRADFSSTTFVRLERAG